MTEEQISQLEERVKKLEDLLIKHTHSGLETSGRLEPKTLLVDIINAKTKFQAGGTNGATGTFVDNNSNTVTVKGGIITSLT